MSVRKHGKATQHPEEYARPPSSARDMSSPPNDEADDDIDTGFTSVLPVRKNAPHAMLVDLEHHVWDIPAAIAKPRPPCPVLLNPTQPAWLREPDQQDQARVTRRHALYSRNNGHRQLQ